MNRKVSAAVPNFGKGFSSQKSGTDFTQHCCYSAQLEKTGGLVPGTVLSMQNIYLVKKNYANPLEGDTKPPEGDNSMKFVYHQLNFKPFELTYKHCATENRTYLNTLQ